MCSSSSNGVHQHHKQAVTMEPSLSSLNHRPTLNGHRHKHHVTQTQSHSIHHGRRRKKNIPIKEPARIVILTVILLSMTSYQYNNQMLTNFVNPFATLRYWNEHEVIPPTSDKLCFVTAQFALDKNETDVMYKPPPALLKRASFFVFSNLQDWNPPNGWNLIVRDYSHQYRRTITQSRVPKFQGFRDEVLQSHCDVVFYMDGSVDILGSPRDFERQATRILQSNVGLMQQKHPFGGGIQKELERIHQLNKDTEENLFITEQWLKRQPDYHNLIPVYHNMYFAYDIHSTNFQQVADYFWDIYSAEHGSWRDQPYWAYALHHLKLQPLEFESQVATAPKLRGGSNASSQPPLFKRNPKREGMNGHTYAKNSNNKYNNGSKRTQPPAVNDKEKETARSIILSMIQERKQARNATQVGRAAPTASNAMSAITKSKESRKAIFVKLCQKVNEGNLTLSPTIEKLCKKRQVRNEDDDDDVEQGDYQK